MHASKSRKLLVASVGVATINFAIAACSRPGPETTGNLPAPPPPTGGVAEVATDATGGTAGGGGTAGTKGP